MRRILSTGSERGGQDGFTLLEIAVVLLMLALIAGLVLPNFYKNSRGMETKIAFRQLGRDIAQLTAEAKGTGETAKIIFSPGSDEYRISFGKETYIRPLNGMVFAGDEQLELEFSSQGMKDGPGTIVFKDRDGANHSYSLHPAKGR